MGEHNNNKISEALHRLDIVLKCKAPALHAKLNAGAGNAEFAELRVEFGGVCIPCIESWFSWHNGAQERPVFLLPLGFVVSMPEAISDRKIFGGSHGFRRRALKILEDGSGDGYFIDIESEGCSVYYHMLLSSTPEYYGELSEFISFIADGFEAGVLFVDQEGGFNYEDDDYEEFERSYLASICTNL